MTSLTVNGKTDEVDDFTRLVTAIKEAGVNIGHRCGGNARCTTCRVTFNSGEPENMTQAEFEKLGDKLGEFRLACQIECHGDMDVNVLMTKESSGWSDTGPEVNANVVPEAIFYPIDMLKSGEPLD